MGVRSRACSLVRRWPTWVRDYSLWSWPILPASNHAAPIAVGLLIAGISTATITGARDRRSD